ncbi:zinc finger CCCH domain-containing protein 18-like [Rhincodon typus]|uniref:zinc finger CCCH domain-containing protein 18-like n=1 Tax=Rhincodon typus TaxID=259920 RepID=UPI00203065AB|nr:zinc finger CCCH domain-containing protein 18-like [Rhincodon typus]
MDVSDSPDRDPHSPEDQLSEDDLLLEGGHENDDEEDISKRSDNDGECIDSEDNDHCSDAENHSIGELENEGSRDNGETHESEAEEEEEKLREEGDYSEESGSEEPSKDLDAGFDHDNVASPKRTSNTEQTDKAVSEKQDSQIDEETANDSKDEASSVIRDLDEHELDYDEEVPEEQPGAVTEDSEKQSTEEKSSDSPKEGEMEKSQLEERKSERDRKDSFRERKKDEDDGELDEGEVEDDDLEEGEVKDPNERKVRPKPICRFYIKGNCTWGNNCRFIHPGINDKGNYSLIAKPDPFSPNGGHHLGPHPLMQANPWETHVLGAPVIDELMPPIPLEPPAESAWERGLRHAKELLNCIMDMVEKTRHSLMVLRRCQEADRVELHHWICCYRNADDMRTGVHGQIPQGQGYIQEEIWKKAEEAVNEVKRQAMTELKKAVLEAEHTAHKMVTAERVKMECALTETKQQASEAIQSTSRQQEASSEGFWNSGRKASETYSGCNVARYCDSFCQHKHWEKHHRICGHNVQHLQSIKTAGNSHNAVTPSPSPSVTSGRDNAVSPSLSPSVTSGRDNAVTPSPSPSVTSGRDNAVTPSPSPSVTSGRDNTVTPSLSPSVTSGRDNPVTPSPSPSATSGRDNPVTPFTSPSVTPSSDNPVSPSPSPSVTSGRENPVTPSPSSSVTSGRDNPVTPSPSPSATSGKDNPVSPSPSTFPAVTSGKDNPVSPSLSTFPAVTSGRDNPVTSFTSPLVTSGRDNPVSPSPSTFPAVTSGKDNTASPWASSSQQIHPEAVASGSDTGSTNTSSVSPPIPIPVETASF